MNENLPLVSIIIPTRNEAQNIKKCLTSIIENDYPPNKLEILVADGMSEDATKEIVENFANTQNHNVRLIDNPEKIMPSGVNVGIKKAKGGMIIILSGHSSIPSDFIRKNVEQLQQRSDIDCVGGVWITCPGTDSIIAKAISLVLSSPFGVGNSYFRIGSNKPRYADTVPFGCYRREIFDEIGLFNEELVRTQDIEFNARIRKNGGKILLCPDIKSYYHARPTLAMLCKQYLRTGIWKIYLTKMSPGTLSIRHFIPIFFVLGLTGSSILSLFWNQGLILLALIGGSYLSASLFFSIKIGLKEEFKDIPILPVVFFSLHFSYSLGMLWGILTSWRFPGKR